jgi:hypothetical protein
LLVFEVETRLEPHLVDLVADDRHLPLLGALPEEDVHCVPSRVEVPVVDCKIAEDQALAGLEPELAVAEDQEVVIVCNCSGSLFQLVDLSVVDRK